MLGSVTNSLLGGIQQQRNPNALSETRAPFVPEPGQTAYGFTFDWSPALGHHSRVSVGYYATSKEAHDALAVSLAGMDYEPPRWWQWWRWGSTKLPDDVMRTVSALKRPTPTETNVNEQGT